MDSIPLPCAASRETVKRSDLAGHAGYRFCASLSRYFWGFRTSGSLLRTRTGAGRDRRSVHRYVARTARVAGISRPIGPHPLRRTVGTVGLNQGIPLRDIQRLLRHARPETTLASYDISGDVLERHAPHQVAGFLAGWAG